MTSRRKRPAEPMIQEACWASSSRPSLRALLRIVRASRGAMIQSRKLRLDRGVANMATSSRKYNPHSGRGLRMAADMTDPCKGLDDLPRHGTGGSSFLDSMMPDALPEEKRPAGRGARLASFSSQACSAASSWGKMRASSSGGKGPRAWPSSNSSRRDARRRAWAIPCETRMMA